MYCLRLLITPLIVWLLNSSLLAQVQETSESQLAEDQIEEIVVLGSLIKRHAVYEGRAPTETLDSETFEATGVAQPVDILSSLTSNTGSFLSTEQNYLQGVSQFSLRGVGLSSTLTLINGRRAGFAPVSNDVGQSFFDINTLPVTLIERVDILRDGASSTYGSQAVAGVANIVTRDSFTGFELSGGFRTSSNQTSDLGFALGFDHPFGNMNLFGTWLKQDENFRTDFDWLVSRAVDPNKDGNIVDGGFDSGRGSPGSFRRAVVHPDGTFSPFETVDGIAPIFADPDCLSGGGYPAGNLCRLDFSDQRTLIAAENRLQLFGSGDIAINDETKMIFELSYSDNKITDRVGNMLLFNGNVENTNGFFIPAQHPFNFWTDPLDDGELVYIPPSQWRPQEHESVSLSYFGRPLGAEANRGEAGEETRRFSAKRLMVGFEKHLTAGWDLEAHLTNAQTSLDVSAERHWIANEFKRVLIEGSWNPFATRLVAPNLITPKTVESDNLPPGLVGRTAANDEETLAEFEGTRIEEALSQQFVGEVIVTSDTYRYGNLGVTWALGTQYRDIQYTYTPDPLNAIGEGPQRFLDFAADSDQSTWAIFVESLLDLGNRAELQLAARREIYDLAGATTDPKIATQIEINPKLSLRASWGSSFQAPSVFQVSGNRSSRTLSDPFRFDHQGVGTCTLNEAGEIETRGDNFATVTQLRGSGLQPQTAQSQNIGFLYRVSRRSALSIDLWALDYRSVIAQGRSFQSILDDDCRDDGIPNAINIQRDSSGQLSAVTTEYENIGVVLTNGIDLNTFYEFLLPVSTLRLSFDATLMNRFDVDINGEGFTNQLGNRNNTNGFAPTPELRFNVGVAWISDPNRVNFRVRYIDAYKNDEVVTEPEVSSWTTTDVNYQYMIEKFLGTETKFSLGVSNIADENPPGLPSGRDGDYEFNLRPGYDGFVHDVRGRTVYLRFDISF